MSNDIRTRDGIPFNFVNGLKVRGMDIESLIPGIEGIPEAGTKYQFAGNGSNTIFTLPVTPYNKDAIEVHVKQFYVHSTDYELVGDTVTLSDPPPALNIGETYNVEIKVTLTRLNGYVDASRVSFEGEDLDVILAKGIPLNNYAQLRVYNGTATQIRVTDPGIAGFFYLDGVTATTTEDNGGTVICAPTVGAKRWKRVFDGHVYPEWFGAVGNDIADDTTYLSDALEAVQENGKTLQGTPGKTYVISTDFTILSPVSIDFAGSVVKQVSSQRGFLQLRANGCVVRNLDVRFIGTRQFISGTSRYRGYSAWQRMCAVWVESSNNKIENISSQNLNNTVCLRGPVEFNVAGVGYTGSDTDPTTAFTYTTLATDNYLDKIHGSDQDFVITGHQQSSLEIGNYTANDITQIQNQTGVVPPHAIYMTNPDGVTMCDSVHVRHGHCNTNLYGVAHKFIGFTNLNIGVLSAVKSTGAALFEDCNGVAVDAIMLNRAEIRLDVSGLPSATARYGAYIMDSRIRIDNLHVDGVSGLECGAALIEGASFVDIPAVLLRSRNPLGGTTAGVVRCEDTSETRIGSISHVVLGQDTKESITALDSAKVNCLSITTTGTTRLARAENSSQIFISVDPQQIDGFDRAAAFIGNVNTSQVMPFVQANFASQTTVYGATTPGTHAYAWREFLCVRKGDEVTVYAQFIIDGACDATGDLRIGPLPYPVAGIGSSANAGVIVTSAANVTLAVGDMLLASANDSESFIRMQTVNGITKTNLDSSALGSNARLEFILQYRTTAAI